MHSNQGSPSEVVLHVVSGKGGTGKTTVAAALAISLATNGHRVLLMEVEGRQGIAQLFDVPPLNYEETKVAVAPGGGEVWALAVDSEDALLDYLEMFYKMRRAGSALGKMGAIEFATTIAPGLRDVLLTGKAIEVVKRKEKNASNAYDFVVLDAPPTGRITRFLNVNSEVSGLAKVGPIKNHADSVMSVIASPLTTVHLVTLLEEMPVQETLDGIADLEANGLPVGSIFVNLMRPPKLDADQRKAVAERTLNTSDIESGLEAVGLNSPALVTSLEREALDHTQRVDLEARELQRLEDAQRTIVRLPLIPAGIDLGALYELAEIITNSEVTK
ncbi:MAG: ArsA-related P-loop ATPase [Candidatus Nanopelagicales bacterium]